MKTVESVTEAVKQLERKLEVGVVWLPMVTYALMYSMHWCLTGCDEVDCHDAEDGEEH